MSETHTLSERYGLREVTPASLVAQAKRILGPDRDPILRPGDSYVRPLDNPPSWLMVNELCRDIIDLYGKGSFVPRQMTSVDPRGSMGNMTFGPGWRAGPGDVADPPGPSHPLKTGVGDV